jgi:STE24 endopeptidase
MSCASLRPGSGAAAAVLAAAAIAFLGWSSAAAQAIAQEPAASATASTPFDVDAAVAAYLARQTPEAKARSDAYFEGGYWLQLWGFLYGLGVAWLLLGRGLSARMRDLASRVSRRRGLQATFYAVGYVVVTTVLYFPLTLYQGFFREHQYGLATQTFGPWFKEQLIGLAVGIVLFGLLISVLYAVFRRAPRTWWLWGSLVGLAFLVFVILIAPVYVDPLFNTYTPLEDPTVRDPILSLARANGIHTDKVYEFDASRQTTRVSANVSGFLGTMRIRLNDNLLKRCTPAEIAAVMAHEIGHYALNHIYESILFFGVVLVGGFAFIRWCFGQTLARWGARWGVTGLSDPAGLPLLAALFSVYFFFLTPVLNTYIRVNEAEADLFGLNAAREPDGFATVALKLAEYRKLAPTPFEEWFFYDHPSGRSRITMAMRWKAEQRK